MARLESSKNTTLFLLTIVSSLTIIFSILTNSKEVQTDMQKNVKVMIDKVAVLRKVVGKYMMRNFKDMPLTGDQSRLLFVIKEHGHSQKEVAQYLHISDATLSVRIKRLEEAGYIIREQNPQDKRHSTVRLSKLGEEYLEICKDKMRHMEEVCSRGLTKEDHDAVLHMIDMIIKNMEDELKEEDDA